MALLNVWQRNELGGLRAATVDHDAIPAGWYDAPDKVPPLVDAAGRIVPPPGARPVAAAASREPAPSGPVHGEQPPATRQHDGRWRRGVSGRRA